MLKSFKKKRTNPKANIQLKKVVEKKRQAKAKREIQESDSGSDISDSDSDSDYEEILISNLKKSPLPKHPREEEELPKEPLPLKRQTKDANHSNHFTEDKPISEEPITKEPDPKPVKKEKKRGKVVIKKYYNYKGKEPTPVEPKVENPKVEERFNYLGFSTNRRRDDSREHMSSRIFNW